MAWTRSQTTKHDCGGVTFGRLTAGCPRCDELAAGAEPVRQPWRGQRAREDAELRQAMHGHFTGERHRSGGCGPVCTAFDW